MDSRKKAKIKFSGSFGDYRLSRAVGEIPNLVGEERRDLIRNPLYYSYYYQFLGAGFFTAWIGRDEIERDQEQFFQEALSEHLKALERKNLYWVKPFKVTMDTTFVGQERRFSHTPEQRARFHVMHKANNCYVRLNELDKHPYADIEFWDHKDGRYKVVRLGADYFHRILFPRLRLLPDDRVYDIQPRFRRLRFYKGPKQDGDLL